MLFELGRNLFAGLKLMFDAHDIAPAALNPN